MSALDLAEQTFYDRAGKLVSVERQARQRRVRKIGRNIVFDAHHRNILRYAESECAQLLQNAVLHKPAEQELAMTGRDPAPWMLDAADYITEMCCRRHPYEKGIPARKGVEF